MFLPMYKESEFEEGQNDDQIIEEGQTIQQAIDEEEL